MRDLFRLIDEAQRAQAGALGARLDPGAAPEVSAHAAAMRLSADRTLFAQLRVHSLIHEELHRIAELLARRFLARPAAGDAATGDPDAADLVDRAQRFLLLHPIATQAIFAALVAEGRRFAATGPGAQRKAALESSELLQRLRRLWEASAFTMLQEDPRVTLPSSYAEVLLQALQAPDLEPLLRRMVGFAGGTRDGSP